MSFSASSEEGVIHSSTTCVLSTYLILVSLGSEGKPTRESPLGRLGPQGQGVTILSRAAAWVPLAVGGAAQERDARVRPQSSDLSVL